MRASLLRMAPSLRDLSAENIALLLAMGLVLGIFPMWGCPTILCALASLVFRVNFPTLQIVNQLCWPLQLAMLVPLARLGRRIVGPSSQFAPSVAGSLEAAALQAIIGWSCVCIPLGFLLYTTIVYLIRRNGSLGLRPPVITPWVQAPRSVDANQTPRHALLAKASKEVCLSCRCASDFHS